MNDIASHNVLSDLDKKYSGFISYAHEDGLAARKVHRALENFRIPKSILLHSAQKEIATRRLGRFFLDRLELSAAPHATSEVNAALGDSRALIVICSKHAADPDRWPNREVQEFRRLNPTLPILAVIVADEPPSCFPPALIQSACGSGDAPLAADLRRDGDGFELAILKLAAGLLDIDLDDLVQRAARAQRRRRLSRALIAASIIGLLGLSIFGLQRMAEARTSRIESEARAQNDIGDHDTAMLLSAAAHNSLGALLRWDNARSTIQAERALYANLKLSESDSGGTTQTVSSDRRKRLYISALGGPIAVDSEKLRRAPEWKAAVDKILNFKYSEEKDRFLALNESGDIYTLNPETGVIIDKIGSRPGAQAVIFDRTGDRILVSNIDRTISLYDFSEQRWLAVSPAIEGRITGFSFSFDTNKILISNDRSTLFQWNVANNEWTRTTTPGHEYRSISSAIFGLVWLICNGDTVIIRQSSVPDGIPRLPERHLRFPEKIDGVIGSSDGQFLFARSFSGKAVYIMDLKYELIHKLHHNDWVYSLAAFDGDRKIGTIGRDSKLVIWKVPKSLNSQVLTSVQGTYRVLLKNSTDSSVFIAGRTLNIIDINTGKSEILIKDVCEYSGPKYCWTTNISTPVKNKNLIAYGTTTGRLSLYDNGAKLIRWNVELGARVVSLIWTGPNESWIVAHLDDGTLRKLSAEDGSELQKVVAGQSGDRYNIQTGVTLSSSPSGEILLLGLDAALTLRSTADLSIVKYPSTSATISTFWSQSGDMILVSNNLNEIYIYKYPQMQINRILRGATSWITETSFVDKNRYVLGTSIAESLLWDTKTGDLVYKIPTGRINSGSGFSPDGRRHVSSVTHLDHPEGFLVADTTGHIRFSPFHVKHPDLSEICMALPNGRLSFSASEMQKFTFLVTSDRNPCRIQKYTYIVKLLNEIRSICRVILSHFY